MKKACLGSVIHSNRLYPRGLEPWQARMLQFYLDERAWIRLLVLTYRLAALLDVYVRIRQVANRGVERQLVTSYHFEDLVCARVDGAKPGIQCDQTLSSTSLINEYIR